MKIRNKSYVHHAPLLQQEIKRKNLILVERLINMKPMISTSKNENGYKLQHRMQSCKENPPKINAQRECGNLIISELREMNKLPVAATRPLN